jgi:hypothetical protein
MATRALKTSCGEVPVLVVGRDGAATPLHELLERCAHPVRQVPTWRAAEQAVAGMRVAVLFTRPADLIACVDRLRRRAPGLRVILVVPAADAELEQLVMLREYIRLTVAGPNLEAMHALVHDALHVTASPEPTALRARS